MIDGLKPYPAMKDSGVPWLGEVPEHWEVCPVRHLAAMAGRKGTTSADTTDADTGVLNATPSELNGRMRGARTRRYLELPRHQFFDIAPPGSTAICTIASVGQSSRFVRPFATNPQVRALVPREAQVTGEFLFLLTMLLKPELQRLASTSVVPFVNGSDVTCLRVVAPPLPEQAAIVRFLDHADRRIRRYIRAKQKLIKLLEEQKQAIIHRAVTRGLDPNIRLKPSGVEWLGDVPEHWEVRQLRRLARRGRRITYGIVQPGEPNPSGRFMVRGQDYSFGWASPKTIFRVSDAIETPYKRSRLNAGDLVLTIVGAGVGNVAIVPDWLEGANITQTTARVSVDPDKADGAFVAAALQGPIGRRNVELYVKGAAQPGLNLEHVRVFLIPLPPVVEQTKIARAVEGDASSLDTARDRARREIELLREYRTRLIADVVTGKLDVREAAARLPDEVGEPELLDEIAAEGDTDEAGAEDTDAVPEEAEA